MLHSNRSCFLLMIVLTVFLAPRQGLPSSSVQAGRDGDRLTLSNETLSATWSIRDGALHWLGLQNQLTGVGLQFDSSPFELVPREGPVLRASDLEVVAGPVLEETSTEPASSKAADHFAGKQIRLEFEDASRKIRISWRATLHESANYIRQEITIHAAQQ